MRYQEGKKKRVKIKWGRLLLCLLVVAAVVFAGVKILGRSGSKTPNTPSNSQSNDGTENNANHVEPNPQQDPDPTKTEVSIRIRCAGDVMVHAGNPRNQLENALQTDGTYDFSHSFKLVSKWLSDADLTLAQFETTFSGLGDYRGYPGFSSPEVLAQNVKDTGVDVALFANNHMMDSRLAGAINTVKVLRDTSFDAICGARTDTSENRSQIVEVNGLKIGITAWTYETPLVDGRRTMNGSYMDANAPNYINSFRYAAGTDGLYHINEEDLAAIKSEMQWLKDQGVDILICYFHWGTEYKYSPDNPDAELAKFAVENGADIVFAGHPHVIQPIEIIDGVPVFYSTGNFVSNQRYETLNEYYGELASRRTEQGIIANVEITVNTETGEIKYDDISAIPTWVNLFYRESDGKWIHQIVPLLDDIDADEGLQISGFAQRAKDALADITEFLGSEYIYKEH